MFDRISIDPNICHGQACIKGTRMPVHQIIGMLANGDTLESLLKAYPHMIVMRDAVQSVWRAK